MTESLQLLQKPLWRFLDASISRWSGGGPPFSWVVRYLPSPSILDGRTTERSLPERQCWWTNRRYWYSAFFSTSPRAGGRDMACIRATARHGAHAIGTGFC
jgi:hypothetical protein